MNILTYRILIFVLLNFLLFVEGDKVIWTRDGYTLYQNLDTVKVNDIVAPNYIAKNAKSVSLTGGGFVTVWTNSTSGHIISQIFDNNGEPVNDEATLYEAKSGNLNLDAATFPNDTYGVTWTDCCIHEDLSYIDFYQYNVSAATVWGDAFGSLDVNYTDSHSIFWKDVYLISYSTPDGVYVYENDKKGKFNVTKVSPDVNDTDWFYTSQIVLRGDFYSVIWSKRRTSEPTQTFIYYRNYKGNGNPISVNINVGGSPYDIVYNSAVLSNNELAIAQILNGTEPFVFLVVFNYQKLIGTIIDMIEVNDISILPVLDGFFLLFAGNRFSKNQTFAGYFLNEGVKAIGPYFNVGFSDTNRPTGAVFSNPQNGNFSISWTNFGQYNTNNIKNKNLFYSTYSLVKHDTNTQQIKF